MSSHLERADRAGELLNALPDVSPPYDFAEFSRRSGQRSRGARTQMFATAAVVVLAVAALAVRLGDRLPDSARTGGPRAAAPFLTDAAAGRSRAPESQDLAQEPAVASLGSRAAVTRLEDRIAQLDDLLSAARAAPDQPTALQRLQQERARVFGTLVQVRAAQNVADQSL
jgi:hypothetical protein